MKVGLVAFLLALGAGESQHRQVACPSSIAISQTGSTDLKTAVYRLRICSVLLISTTAQSVSLVEGTGSTCGTGTTALIGATTAANGMALAATGGFALAAEGPFLQTKTIADHLCLLQSGAGLVAGLITYQDGP